MKTETDNQAGERTQHTPGPWFQNGAQVRSLFGRMANNTEIATVCGLDVEDSEFRANARLIAAAPELLHAVRAMMRWSGALQPSKSRDLPDFTEAEVIALAVAAIARAEGRQP